MIKLPSLFIFALCTVTGLSAQVNYVQMAKPFSSGPVFQTRKAPVSNTAIQVPIITWAADGTTIAANGGMTRSATSKLAQSLGVPTSIVLQDDFEKQIADYISGKSPFLRGTLGMINLAAEGLAAKDPGLEPVVFYQLSWSTGADGFVGRNISKINELKGKTIVVQKNGPHIDLVRTLLQSAGLKSGDVTIKYVRDITDIGEGGVHDPAGAMRNDPKVAGAACIYPDIISLTKAGGKGRVPGARPILTTKTANRVIADVYAVRRDWFESNAEKVAKMRDALLAEQERFIKELARPSAAFKAECRPFSKLFLLDESLVDDYLAWVSADSQLAGEDGNFEFFERKGWAAGFASANQKIQEYYLEEGFIAKRSVLISDFEGKESEGFGDAIAEVDWDKLEAEEEFLTYAFPFAPNKADIRWQDYKNKFSKVFDMHQSFGGGAILVNGHVDPTLYNLILDAEKLGKPDFYVPSHRKTLLRRDYPDSKAIMKGAQQLSQRRADAIKKEYKKYVEGPRSMKVGVDFYNNIDFAGKGLSEPVHRIAKTGLEATENRRVDVKVYELPVAELDF